MTKPFGPAPSAPSLGKKLSLEEKLSLLAGRDFWHTHPVPALGLPAVLLTDGPHGVRKQLGDPSRLDLDTSAKATCFPTASALAATWNPALLSEVGAALGREARALGVGVLLGPGLNIKRSPLCGRNFEYFSEDPWLSGALAAAYVEGVQSEGVGACLKHFAANNQEHRRFSIDAVVDERALKEIYLAGFEIAVKQARPWAVMAAYNRLNGLYCTESPWLLDDVLRGEWGYEGLVVSDWGAVNDPVQALKAGLDLQMPGVKGATRSSLRHALAGGHLDEATVDRGVQRVLRLAAQVAAAQVATTQVAGAQEGAETAVGAGVSDGRGGAAPGPGSLTDAHHAFARRVATEGAVLLKNALLEGRGALLPLDPGRSVAVVGAFAKEPRYQGAGSSGMRPTRVDVPFDELVAALGGGARVSYAPGYGRKGDHTSPALLDEVRRVARAADTVVVFAGLPETFEVEGVDRPHLELPDSHNAAIEAALAENPNVVVVLQNGAPVAMPWHSRVPAILEAYLGGQAGGGAIADLLTGRMSPSGKLAETFPLHLEDTAAHACFPGGPRTVEYRESLYVGYRFFDSAGEDVLFPFGHGLSYTTFAYDELELGRTTLSAEDESLEVRLRVTNTGARAGQEVVQLYVHDVESAVFRPEQELKGFTKVALDPGESAVVTLPLDRRAFAFYDVAQRRWVVEPGAFELRVGASSRDIRLRARLEVASDDVVTPEPEVVARAYRQPVAPLHVPEAAFEALYGGALPDNAPYRPGGFTSNTPIQDMRDSGLARLLYAVLKSQLGKAVPVEPDNPVALVAERLVSEMPLRPMVMMSGGALTPEVMDAIVDLLNRRWWSGAKQLLRTLRPRGRAGPPRASG